MPRNDPPTPSIDSIDSCRGARRPSHELVELWNDCSHRDDEQSWNRLLGRLHGDLLSEARRILRQHPSDDREPSSAEDVLQELYLKMLANRRRMLRRARFVNDGQLRIFLRRVLGRIVLDQRRRRSRSRRVGRAVAVSASGTVAHRSAMVCEARDPEATYRARESLQRFARDCDLVASATRQSDRTRQICRRTFFEERAASEVAREVGTSINGVHVVVHRVRRELHRRFGYHFRHRSASGARAVNDGRSWS